MAVRSTHNPRSASNKLGDIPRMGRFYRTQNMITIKGVWPNQHRRFGLQCHY